MKFQLSTIACAAFLTGCVVRPSVAPRVVAAPARADTIRVATAPEAAHPVATAAADTSARMVVALPTAAEVSNRASEVFGDIAPASPDTTVSGPRWDIDVRSYETQERVARYVTIFSGPARRRITERLKVGSRYEPMIRARMKAGGLPEDMYYLALIESGFDPHAYSKAAAVGMWQFMSSTARDMGMRVDWWVDERRDPVRSTGAAVRFIRGLRDQFGSLYLAAAAYNGGPGRISRGLSKYADDLEGSNGEDVYFALAEKDYLRSETKGYVPQLIAAALVAKDPKRYGMEFTPLPPFAYDSVRAPARTPLAAIAQAAGVTVGEVKELNPHILRGMTPPKDAMWVRVPVGSSAGFDSGFVALPKDALVATRSVTTKAKETLGGIAERFGLGASELARYNPGVKKSKKGRLVAGQELVVPTRAVIAASLDVPDPSIEKYPNSKRAHTSFHVVKHGETLGGIAKKYGTSTKSLMRLNGLRKPLIFPGQELVVKGEVASRKAKARKSAGIQQAGEPRAAKSARAPARSAAKKKAPAQKKPAPHKKSSKKKPTPKAKR
ncbi:MAG: hypothetical protein JWO05_3398 [Gemmatimonadetes bacterium]|nr:hypothetical protein [Gemmatimonadota bacterium]